MRLLEEANVILSSTGKGAFDVTEQLRLDQFPRDGGAIDRVHLLGSASARFVDRIGKHLLAGTAFAKDQHGYLVDRGSLSSSHCGS